MSASAKRRIKIYSVAFSVLLVLWVVIAWIYQGTQDSPEIGKGRLDLWLQFLTGGWASDLTEKIECGKAIQYPKKELSYLIAAGFIIQGLGPAVAAIVIAVELIELNWRITMRASGLLLEQQDRMAVHFREVMLNLLPESERVAREREMDWLSQDTAYEVIETWCKERGPREMGQTAAQEALAEIQEMRKNFRDQQPQP